VLLTDAGPLVASAATREAKHAACRALLRAAARPIVIPQTVVTEVAYLLRSRLGPHAEAVFTRSIRDGEVMVEPVHERDWARIAELVETYLDLPLGLVDASLVAIAERLDQTRIASLDHRHLGVVEPRHCDRFELVP
jgi:predicted nucleic acid-binding protein